MRIITNCNPDGNIGPIRVIYLGAIVKYRVDRVAGAYLLVAIDELGQETIITKTAFDTEALALIATIDNTMEGGAEQMDLRLTVTSVR